MHDDSRPERDNLPRRGLYDSGTHFRFDVPNLTPELQSLQSIDLLAPDDVLVSFIYRIQEVIPSQLPQYRIVTLVMSLFRALLPVPLTTEPGISFSSESIQRIVRQGHRQILAEFAIIAYIPEPPLASDTNPS